MSIPIDRMPDQYVIRITSPSNGCPSYVNDPDGKTALGPEHARKFSTPADAHCWLESHGHSFDDKTWKFDVCVYHVESGMTLAIN